ncbi:hypothetical protein [Teredinibacter purpureus]|uniref:hypothetical protein n=1 Tax=Teredinibacter purpureus TaxID=2731756 RepID=UPI0005F86447|nr:hypothetical protein [Teredinibacter purpureus]
MEIFLSTIRDILAIIAVIFLVYRFSVENFRTLSQNNLKELIAIYENIKDNPNLLECYGITEEEIKSTGLDVKQFVHLLQDFTAGQLFFDTMFKFPKKPRFWPESYRYKLCSLATTQSSWPYLKLFFPTSGRYGQCIENTINSMQ